jgi:DNA-binding response OmpR family regulator
MPRPRILLVDDDPDLLRALRLRLRANNYEVTTASDGYAAIAAAQKERPALIILDLGLPVGDGFVVLVPDRSPSLTLNVCHPFRYKIPHKPPEKRT